MPVNVWKKYFSIEKQVLSCLQSKTSLLRISLLLKCRQELSKLFLLFKNEF
jgi:hypothetical protein